MARPGALGQEIDRVETQDLGLYYTCKLETPGSIQDDV
jgi:hypothetical protein